MIFLTTDFRVIVIDFFRYYTHIKMGLVDSGLDANRNFIIFDGLVKARLMSLLTFNGIKRIGGANPKRYRHLNILAVKKCLYVVFI